MSHKEMDRGPWFQGALHKDEYTVYDGMGLTVARVTDEPMNPFGFGWKDDEEETGPPGMLENARLIAAAPELYTAAQSAVSEISMQPRPWLLHTQVVYDALERAIRKVQTGVPYAPEDLDNDYSDVEEPPDAEADYFDNLPDEPEYPGGDAKSLYRQ